MHSANFPDDDGPGRNGDLSAVKDVPDVLTSVARAGLTPLISERQLPVLRESAFRHFVGEMIPLLA